MCIEERMSQYSFGGQNCKMNVILNVCVEGRNPYYANKLFLYCVALEGYLGERETNLLGVNSLNVNDRLILFLCYFLIKYVHLDSMEIISLVWHTLNSFCK